jgi:histidinol dehydrogenase
MAARKVRTKTGMAIVADGSAALRARLALLADRQNGGGDVEKTVAAIIAAVRRRGDEAVLRYTARFDGVKLAVRDLIVPKSEIDHAFRTIPTATRNALQQAHRRIVRFHALQQEKGFEAREPGLRLGMRVAPLAKVGVYVPGGRAAYPSSVLMNITPARVAGVDDITVVTPPSSRGIRPEVLAAARIAGATRVVRAGGAQAVAALAYGTDTIPRVDKIVGPGNRYVATAKRLVFGQVDIDMIAGPTEVLIIADETARPDFVAADMLAQAEHDPDAAAICLTTTRAHARAVAQAVQTQLETLSRRDIAARSLERYGTIAVVGTLDRAAEIADEIAAEHLELFVRNPRPLARRIRNAGAIFLGQYTTESLGDYAAGPNHVLPTGGSARFSSPLGVYDFVKRTSIIEATRDGLARLARTVEDLADSEGLQGHGLAVRRRLEQGEH